MTVTVNNEDSKINVLKDEKKKADTYGSYPHIVDGDIYFRLFAADDTKYETPLGETKVTKNTVEPTVAKVTATRNNTDNATFKAERYGASDETKATKIYYCAVAITNVQADNNDAVTWNPTTKQFSKNDVHMTNGFTPETKTIEVSGDSIEKVISGLSNSTAYRIYYVVENSYGSQTEITGSGISLPQIDVGSDVNADKEESVGKENITLPTGTESTKNKFKWNNPHTQEGSNAEHGYIVTLYKDGKVYRVEEVSEPSQGFELKNYYSPLSAIEAGEYYIEVVTKGSVKDNQKATVNSDAVKSDTLTVKAVDPVSNIKYSTNEGSGNPKLSWDEDDENCSGYKLLLYKEDVETGVFAKKTGWFGSMTRNSETKSITIPTTSSSNSLNFQIPGWNTTFTNGPDTLGFDRNTGFYVGITANVKSDLSNNDEENTIYVNSQTEYFYFCAPYRDAKITSATDSSMTFKLDTETNVVFPKLGAQFAYGEDEDDLSYAVRVYKNISGGYRDMGTKEVKTSYDYEDGKITATYFTVEGLEANTDYQFRLITKCGEFEGWSDKIIDGRTMPRIQNLTCEDKEGDCANNENTFFSQESKLTIDKNTYQDTDFKDINLQKEFQALEKFLSNLKEGDKVTITGDVIDLVLSSKASDSKEVTFGDNDFLDGKILNITGTDYERKIKDTSSTKYPAEVHLKEGQFDLTEFTKGKDEVVTLGNGVKIKTGTTELGDLIVETGAEVTVNNVKMKTDLQTAIKAKIDGKNPTLTVVANGEESNNLVFENLNNSVNAENNDGTVTIKFVSSNGTETTQQGSITIKGNGGKVTVTQDNVTIGSDIEVTVENGEVDVTDKKLTGEKTVTLSAKKDNKTAKITAIAETAAPDELKGKTIVIKEYTVDTLKTSLNGSSSGIGSNITKDVVKVVNEWLEKFGVANAESDGKGVKVTVDSADGTKVTIENNSDEDVEISGLK